MKRNPVSFFTLFIFLSFLFSFIEISVVAAAQYPSAQCYAIPGGYNAIGSCSPGDISIGDHLNTACQVSGVCCVPSGTVAPTPQACTASSCTATPGQRCTSGFTDTCTFEERQISDTCANAASKCCKLLPSCSSQSGTCYPGACPVGYGGLSASGCTQAGQCCKQLPSGGGGTVGPTSLNYTLLEQIPGSNNWQGDLPSYLKNLYGFAFWAIGIAALLMLSVGGFMYATSAGNTSRMGTAKTIIFDSLLGIVVAILAWLFPYVINPDLTKIKLPAVTPIPVTTITPPGPVTPITGTGCGGLNVSGINQSQCNDASQELSNLLACIKSKDSSILITSISDSAGFSNCKNSWARPPCAHSATSCHYGGGSTKTSASCQKSQAVDFRIKNAAGSIDHVLKNKIVSLAASCGGRVNIEGDHVHVSTQTNCCTL